MSLFPNSFYISSVLNIILLATINVTRARPCSNNDDCDWCGFCIKDLDAKPPKTVCYYPFPDVHMKNGRCVDVTLCSNGYCQNGGTCTGARGFAVARCNCDISKYYGSRCEHKIEKGSELNFATGIAIFHTVLLDKNNLGGPYSVTVFATTMHSGKDLLLTVTTSEGDGVSFNELQGECNKFSNIPIYTYKKHCSLKYQCVQRLPDCKNVYTTTVVFPFKLLSEPEVLTFANGNAGYLADFTISVINTDTEVFKYNYKVMVSYEDFGINNVNDIPGIKLQNCPKHWDQRLVYYRKSNINFEGKVTNFNDNPIFQQIQTFWKLLHIEYSSKLYEPNIFKMGTVYHWNLKPFRVPPGLYKVRFLAYVVLPTGKVSNYDECYFEIATQPLVARIDGGAERTVLKDNGLLLSGAGSRDPNEDFSNQNHLQFSWSCHPLCNEMVNSDKKTFFIKPDQLEEDKKYNFSLKVSAPGLKSEYAQQIVHVGRYGLYIECVMNCLKKMVPTEFLILRAQAGLTTEEGLKFIWTFKLEDGKDEPVDSAQDSTYPSNVLCIKRNMLEEGKKYYFQTRIDRSNLTAGIFVDVKKRPSTGSCTVFPVMGVAAKTSFTINCTGFIDEDKTLIYEYFDRDGSDTEKEFTGKMIASNSDGLLEDVKLTRGVVAINIYNTLGLPAIVTLEVKLTPNDESAEVIEDIFKTIEHLNDFGETKAVLMKGAEIADLVTTSMNKSNIAKKLTDSMLKVSFKTQGDMKTALSVMNNTIAALTKDGDFIFQPNLLKDVTRLIISLTKRFEHSTLSNTVIPQVTGLMMEDLTVAFLDVIDLIFINRNTNILSMTEDHMTPSDFKDTQETTENLEDSLLCIAYTLSSRHRKGFQKYTITSSQLLSSFSTLSDTPQNLHDKLKGDAIYSIEISSELAKELKNLKEVVVESMTIKYNPFWSERKDISTDILTLNMYKRTKTLDRITPIHKINNPLDLFLKVNKKHSGSIQYSIKQVDPTMDIDILDNKVTVVKVLLTDRSKIFVKFLFNSSYDALRVLISNDFRPDFDSMIKLSKLITYSNPVYEVPYRDRESDVFIYIGILPGPNVLIGDSVRFTMSFHYNLCLTLIRHYWVPQYCSIGDLTNSTIIHCRCTHLSILSAVFAVPPSDIDPFKDMRLFLTIKDNALVVIVVMIILLVFFLLCLWACFKDRRELIKRNVIDLEDNFPDDPYVYIVAVFTGCRFRAGTSANVGIHIQGDNATSRRHVLKSSTRRVFHCNSDDWFFLRTPTYLGTVETIHLWHDSSGSSPDWFCERIVVFDTLTKTAYTFFVEQWLALDFDEYPEAIVRSATTDDFNRRRKIFFDNLIHGFRNGHICVGIVAKHPRHVKSRIDQVVILMTLLMLAMLISIAFYYVEGDEGFDDSSYSIGTREIIISVQTFILSLFIIFIVMLLFNKSYASSLKVSERSNYIYARTQDTTGAFFKSSEDTKRQTKLSFYKTFVATLRKRFKPLPLLPISLSDSPSQISRHKVWYILAWSLSLALVFTCSYLVMLYGLKLGYEESKKWMTSTSLALLNQLFVMSPLRIILLALLLASSFESLARTTNYNIEISDSNQTKYVADTLPYIEWVKTRSNMLYRPLTLREIDMLTLKRHQRAVHMLLVELAVVAVFIVILCYANGNHFEHDPIKQNLHVGKMISHSNVPLVSGFEDVFNRTQFLDYLKEPFIQSLFRLKWYNFDSLGESKMHEGSKFWTKDFTTKLVMPPILRQLRVYKRQCILNKIFKNASMECIPKWSKSGEDTDHYEFGWKVVSWSSRKYITNAWQYTEPSQSFCTSYTGETGTRYHGGGYIAKLSSLKDKTRLDLQTLIESQWIDQFTRVVFVTFILYNVNYDLFTQVILIAEHLPSGEYLTRTIMESMHLRIFLHSWEICYLLVMIFLIFRTILVINRKGFKKHFSSFKNRYQLLLLVLGVFCVVFFVTHIIKSAVYVKEYMDEEVDDFFPFDDIIFYGNLTDYTAILLLCGLVLYFFKAWYSSRRSSIAYYMVRMSYKQLLWIVTLLALFILVISGMISSFSHNIILISTCIWRWSKDFPCATRNGVVFALSFVFKVCSVLILAVFTYQCKQVKLKKQPARTDLICSLLKTRSKGSVS